MFKKRRIISVFQPHRYSRVERLKKEFSLSFKLSDQVILCPIYPAGEKKISNFSQDQFSSLISKKSNVQVANVNNELTLLKYFRTNLFKKDLVVCMGAGSISNWIRNIKNEL